RTAWWRWASTKRAAPGPSRAVPPCQPASVSIASTPSSSEGSSSTTSTRPWGPALAPPLSGLDIIGSSLDGQADRVARRAQRTEVEGSTGRQDHPVLERDGPD